MGGSRNMTTIARMRFGGECQGQGDLSMPQTGRQDTASGNANKGVRRERERESERQIRGVDVDEEQQK